MPDFGVSRVLANDRTMNVQKLPVSIKREKMPPVGGNRQLLICDACQNPARLGGLGALRALFAVFGRLSGSLILGRISGKP